MDRRLLVTGGSGFIGSHIVRQAAANGWRVAVLDNMHAEQPEGVRIYGTDIRNDRDLFRVFHDFMPTHVSHHAAQISVPESFVCPELDASTNIGGSLNVLRAAASHGVSRFIFASSGGAIYGNVPFPSVADELCTVPKPASPYGVSKLAFEQLLTILSAQTPMQINILRYANVYGPRQRLGVVSRFIDAALADKPLTVFGPTNTRDYVHVRDVVRANMRALDNVVRCPVMNVATGRGTTTGELAEIIVRVTRSRSKIIIEQDRVGDVSRSVLSSARFRENVGFSTLLEAGIRETIDQRPKKV